MGYMHIANLYKAQEILLFKECYALEKVHGTSAHISWEGKVSYFSGGEKMERFKALFDEARLAELFTELGHPNVTVFGEAYGGSQQGQAWRYGKELKFVAFEVLIGESWLDVPNAQQVAERLGFEFVAWNRVSSDIRALDFERDLPSTQAQRNGVGDALPREGVVLRPLMELRDNRGNRIMAKHKRDEERETAKPRKVVDPSQQEVLLQATAIAQEWVTPTRLEHVLDKMPGVGIEKTGDVIKAMVEDVLREGAGEFVDSKEARQAIGRRAAELFKAKLKAQLG